MSVETNKRVVLRVVEEVINGGDLDAVDELYAPELAAAARDWVRPFRSAFPDVRMDAVALIGEGDTVVGHFRCSERRRASGWDDRPPNGRSGTSARSTGSPCATAASSTGGASRTTTTVGSSFAGRAATAERARHTAAPAPVAGDRGSGACCASGGLAQLQPLVLPHCSQT